MLFFVVRCGKKVYDYYHSGFVATHALGHMSNSLGQRMHLGILGKPYIICPNAWVATEPLWWWPGGHMVFMITYILRSSCFCEIWTLCVSWITHDLWICCDMPATDGQRRSSRVVSVRTNRVLNKHNARSVNILIKTEIGRQ